MPDTPQTAPVRALHEFALHTNIRLSRRIPSASDPHTMWAYASGSAAAWALHRTLAALAELDPDRAAALAATLEEEGEWPEMTDPCAAAADLGFPAQEWVDEERARRDKECREASATRPSSAAKRTPGWDRADFRCGRCGARRTATTETEYTATVAAHQHAHTLWDRLTPAERRALTDATRIVLGDLRLSTEWLHLVTLHAEQTARKDPTP